MDKLGISSNESIDFLWCDRTKESRQACCKIVAIATTPVEKIAAILCIEASARVMFTALSPTALSPVVDDLQKTMNTDFKWLGGTHREEEINHSIFDDNQTLIEQLDIDSSIKVMEQVYLIFENMWQEWYQFCVN